MADIKINKIKNQAKSYNLTYSQIIVILFNYNVKHIKQVVIYGN
jgi:hypothetical protein